MPTKQINIELTLEALKSLERIADAEKRSTRQQASLFVELGIIHYLRHRAEDLPLNREVTTV